MKNRFTALSICLVFSSMAIAQVDNVERLEVPSIDDIVTEQQAVTVQNRREQHFANVWKRRSYTNLSYGTIRFSPKEDIPTGVRDGIVPDFKSNWDFSLQVGRSYRLHKKPIANLAQFNIDYSGIDLNISHMKQEGDGKNLYDSNMTFIPDGKTAADAKYYIPWNLEKYEADYGMSIGPSLTLSPFTSTKANGLHFLQLHCYYHIGYQASIMYFVNDEDADVNQEKNTNHKTLGGGTKLNWGHGLTQSFGIVLSWKGIGIGYEHRNANLRYKSIESDDYGSDTYKFNNPLNRIFIQFRH